MAYGGFHTVPYGMAGVFATRLSKEDWADAALSVIGDLGIEAVAVEPIAASLGVTKGSFYWHFRSRSDLVDAALVRWEQRATADIIARLAPIDDPTERLRALFVIAFLDTAEERIEDAILRAVANPSVDAVVDRVNGQRLEFLVHALRELGFPLSASRHRARIAYGALLGHRRLQASSTTRLGATAVRRFGEELVERLTS